MRDVKRLAAILAIGLVATPALAIECPLTHAIYEQPGRYVTMRFSEVPRDAASNQIAGFTIAIEGVAARLGGGIYLPNGFGQPLGDVGRDCTEESTDCSLWSDKVYALVDGGIVDFPYDADAEPGTRMAPEQVLLSDFASSVWYSTLRGDAFSGDREVLDVFTLAACVK